MKLWKQYLPEFIYGGIDGSITTFAVVAGAFGAGFSSRIIIVLGIANLIADGFSMSIGNYLSVKSQIASSTTKENSPNPVYTALATFISFNLIGFVPLMIYVLAYIIGYENYLNSFIFSCILTAISFITIGFLKSFIQKTNMIKGIMETLILGIIAALFAYFAGFFLEHYLIK